jgi:carbamoyltransferase
MYTLGINAAFHDSSACLVHDGVVIAAAEEERFTQIKHAKRPIPFAAYELPHHAIDYCLMTAGITLADIAHVAYSYDPALKPENSFLIEDNEDDDSCGEGMSGTIKEGNVWDPLFLTYIANAPHQLVDAVPHHLQRRFEKCKGKQPYMWHFVEHHIAHAASAFYPSPFHEAAILVMDGRGEMATTSYGIGESVSMELFKQVYMPHSLGLLYEEVTAYLGFLRSSDEYKVMALASFGRPEYMQEFREMITLLDNGRFEINALNLEERFGPRRKRGEPFKGKHYDIAHSLQKALEETALQLVGWLYDKTRVANLCMAGGVALNCVMNSRIRDESQFENIWVQPAASDAGTSLGAALWIDQQERKGSQRTYVMEHAYLGPSFSDEEIEEYLLKANLPYTRPSDLVDQVAELLTCDKIVGWFQGRMEFGPRALGSRSILASPLHAEMQTRLNFIKDREDFRPVAPVVLEDQASLWFHGLDTSPFMLFVNKVHEHQMKRIPAICHIDGTARAQTVRREQNPLYYELIEKFGRMTGVSVLINTSFNIKGKPIVCTPADALACFYTSPIDVLVMGPFILQKE